MLAHIHDTKKHRNKQMETDTQTDSCLHCLLSGRSYWLQRMALLLFSTEAKYCPPGCQQHETTVSLWGGVGWGGG